MRCLFAVLFIIVVAATATSSRYHVSLWDKQSDPPPGYVFKHMTVYSNGQIILTYGLPFTFEENPKTANDLDEDLVRLIFKRLQ
ncbi:hypothetical protein L596_000728 [Steinernema carpocapsae]|uniref:Uncharacterized protein n=1 Tax=Steinernema carpocapsae TaxID=34508 RepID=A0A4U8UIZ5_STECR|nr:hypothetical protein L596_000728 [Steinernema carpocapsae]